MLNICKFLTHMERPGCTCSPPDVTPVFTAANELDCNKLCKPDEPNAGFCGSDKTVSEGLRLYNLYERIDKTNPPNTAETTTVTFVNTIPTTTSKSPEPTEDPSTCADNEIITYTITSCPPAVHDCPYGKTTTATIVHPRPTKTPGWNGTATTGTRGPTGRPLTDNASQQGISAVLAFAVAGVVGLMAGF
jgi:hypothetical protein